MLYAPRPCFAEWKVSYSSPSDTVTIVGPDGVQWKTRYADKNPGHGGGGVSSTKPMPKKPTMVGKGSVDCAGAITATLTWEGTEPRPKCVILKETATAFWKGASGACDPALMGGTVTPTGDAEVGYTKTAVKYSVVNTSGGNPPNLTVSPTANASQPTDPGSAAANVSYTVEPTEVRVDVTGTTPLGNGLCVLTGQQLKATLSAGSFLQATTIPAWSFALGADLCFGDFVISATVDNTKSPPVTVEQGKSEVKDVNFGVKELLFYTKKDGTIKVAATATVHFPDGKTDTVNAESKPVQSKRPIVEYWTIKTGYVGWDSHNNETIMDLFSDIDGDKMQFRGYDDWATTGRAARGQDWTALVNVPAPFSGGQFMWGQIITPERHAFFHSAPTDEPGPFNGITGLDTRFPYGGDQNGLGTVGTIKKDIGDSPYKAKDGYKITASDSFQTWLMFRPSSVAGQGTTYVPLQKYSWSWSGTAEDQNQVSSTGGEIWKITALSDMFSPTPVSKTASDTDTFPIWLRKVTAY